MLLIAFKATCGGFVQLVTTPTIAQSAVIHLLALGINQPNITTVYIDLYKPRWVNRLIVLARLMSRMTFLKTFSRCLKTRSGAKIAIDRPAPNPLTCFITYSRLASKCMQRSIGPNLLKHKHAKGLDTASALCKNIVHPHPEPVCETTLHAPPRHY